METICMHWNVIDKICVCVWHNFHISQSSRTCSAAAMAASLFIAHFQNCGGQGISHALNFQIVHQCCAKTCAFVHFDDKHHSTSFPIAEHTKFKFDCSNFFSVCGQKSSFSSLIFETNHIESKNNIYDSFGIIKRPTSTRLCFSSLFWISRPASQVFPTTNLIINLQLLVLLLLFLLLLCGQPLRSRSPTANHFWANWFDFVKLAPSKVTRWINSPKKINRHRTNKILFNAYARQ